MEIESKLFEGIDKFLEESLFSYGVLVSIKPTKDDKYCIIYRTQFGEDGYCNEFDIRYMSEKELISKTQEEWFLIDDFMATCDTCIENWITDTTMAAKVSDMITYYSYEDIFGISYAPFTKEQTIDFINQYK